MQNRQADYIPYLFTCTIEFFVVVKAAQVCWNLCVLYLVGKISWKYKFSDMWFLYEYAKHQLSRASVQCHVDFCDKTKVSLSTKYDTVVYAIS